MKGKINSKLARKGKKADASIAQFLLKDETKCLEMLFIL